MADQKPPKPGSPEEAELLRAENVALKEQLTTRAVVDQEITAKTAAGLTPAQAARAVGNQRRYETRKAEAAKAKDKAK